MKINKSFSLSRRTPLAAERFAARRMPNTKNTRGLRSILARDERSPQGGGGARSEGLNESSAVHLVEFVSQTHSPKIPSK